jgi:hypothetical protein
MSIFLIILIAVIFLCCTVVGGKLAWFLASEPYPEKLLGIVTFVLFEALVVLACCIVIATFIRLGG